LGATKIISATDYDGNFRATINYPSYLTSNVIDDIGVYAKFSFARKCLTRKLK
jgi:hypothetical protein